MDGQVARDLDSGTGWIDPPVREVADGEQDDVGRAVGKLRHERAGRQDSDACLRQRTTPEVPHVDRHDRLRTRGECDGGDAAILGVVVGPG